MNREAAAATAASVVPSELGVAPLLTLMFFGFSVPFSYFMSIFVKIGKLGVK